MVPRSLLRVFALAALGPFLASCDLLPSYFGTSDDGPPLPGERISIMAFGQTLQPDPSIADLEIRLPAPYLNTAWSQTGGSPSHAMYHLELADLPSEAWRVDIGEGSDDDQQILASPIVVEDKIYTLDSRSLVSAYDVASGKRLWQVDIEQEDEEDGFFGGGLGYDNGRLYVSTGFAMVFALDAATGETIWAQPVPAPVRAAPTISGGRVFLVTIENQTLALATEDGRRLWEHTGLQEPASLLGAANPAVSGSTLIVPYTSGELYAILVENGRVLWNDGLAAVNRVDPVADMGHIRALPVIDRNLVLAISNSGTMAAIDLRRGARVWDAQLGGAEMPWVAGDFVYILTNDAQVVCLSRRDGRIRWVQLLPQFEDPEDREDPIQWLGPVLAGDRLIVMGSHEEAISLSPYDGEILGRIDLPDAPALAPIVAGRSIYYVTQNASLIALR